MNPVPPPVKTINAIASFKVILEKEIQAYQKRMIKEGVDYDKSIFFLTIPIIKRFKEEFAWAIIWKLISQCINIILPFFITGFVKAIKSPNEFDYYYGFRTCFSVLGLSLLSGIINEQSNKNTAIVRAVSG
jgi:hypothetical protein